MGAMDKTENPAAYFLQPWIGFSESMIHFWKTWQLVSEYQRDIGKLKA
jgi:hypothetical protein